MFDDTRARKGKPAYLYIGGVHTSCERDIRGTNCYSELWRGTRLDGGGIPKMVDKDSQTSNLDSATEWGCVAATIGRYYRRPTKHWSKNVLTLIVPKGHYWGQGPGPDGWTCTGQLTPQLQCRRDVPKTFG